LKNFLKSKIASNLLSLTSAEISSRVLGFLTLVYLGRILDISSFGVLGFATAFVSYFILVVNFGFSTYGTREIAKDQSRVSKFVNNIFSIRILLAIFLNLLLILLMFFSGKSTAIKTVVLLTGLNLFTNAISLNWVFQAVEKMRYIAMRQVLSGLLSLIGAIIFVHSKTDVVIAALILSLSALLGNIWFIPIYQKMFAKIKPEYSIEFWKELFRESFPLAFASIMIGIYYNLDMVMLGYMKPESDVGIYNAAYKIFLLGIVPFQLIFSAFFPMLSRIGLNNSKELKDTMKNYAAMIIGSGIVTGIVLLFFSERIVLLIFGEKYLASSLPLSILAMNAIVISFNVFLGNPMMAWGKQKEYAIAISFGALTNVILNIILIPKYSYIGAAYATLSSEICVLIGLFYLFNKFTTGLYIKYKI
jgi:O-antigen/teichoic acid export membrane protein